MPKKPQLTFLSYAERRLHLALYHEFLDQIALESLIMLLISEADTFDPADFKFLYPMIEISPYLSRKTKISLYERFQALCIPVCEKYKSKILEPDEVFAFRGLFSPLNMPMLKPLLGAGWLPRPKDLTEVPGISEFRWVIERISGDEANNGWKVSLVKEILLMPDTPNRGQFLEYLFESEGWDLSQYFDRWLQLALINRIDIYRKYRNRLCLFHADAAISYLRSSRYSTSANKEVLIDALEVATPRIRTYVTDRSKQEDIYMALISPALYAIRTNTMGLLERILLLAVGEINIQSADDQTITSIDLFMSELMLVSAREEKIESVRLLFRYRNTEQAKTVFRSIPRASKYNSFFKSVSEIFREHYGVEPPTRW